MGGEQAANTLADVKAQQLKREGRPVDEAILSELRRTTLDAFGAQLSAYHSTSELWDDGILDPVLTRDALGIALAAALNKPFGREGYGVVRM